jgi:hypothetical protein
VAELISKPYNSMETKPLVVWPDWLHECRSRCAVTDVEVDHLVPSKFLDGKLLAGVVAFSSMV